MFGQGVMLRIAKDTHPGTRSFGAEEFISIDSDFPEDTLPDWSTWALVLT